MTISSFSLSSLPFDLQSLVQTTQAVVTGLDQITSCFRRANEPHLFLLGEGLHVALSGNRLFSVAACLAALARHSLALLASYRDLSHTWNRLLKIQLLPSSSTLIFLLATKNKSLPRSPLPLLSLIFHELAERLLLVIELIDEIASQIFTTAFEAYRFLSVLFCLEGREEDARKDLFINLQACSHYLFEQPIDSKNVVSAIQPIVQELLHAIDSGPPSSTLWLPVKQVLLS